MNIAFTANIFNALNDFTGFANGNEFTNEQAVRAYFTIENMEDMFREDWGVHTGVSQSALDIAAANVIANRWNCAF